jgi:hypothetical protein
VSELAKDYLVLVFVASLGSIQAASAYADLRGLFLIPSRRITAVISLVLAIGAFAWFFAGSERNLPDTGGGIAGPEQFTLFALMCGLALLITYCISSLTNISLREETLRLEDGIRVLQRSTILRFWIKDILWIREKWKILIHRFFSG